MSNSPRAYLYSLKCFTCFLESAVSVSPKKGGGITGGAGGGIRTPDRLITNQLLYRTELRQPDKEHILALPMPLKSSPGGSGI